MSHEPIPSTKETPGSYDAIETAKPGEPLFPIQGGDPFGPPTVLFWARQAREAGMAEPDEKKAEHLLRKATDAEQVAWRMQAYQRGEAAAEGRRATYNDSVAEELDAARTEREARIRGSGRLHNFLAGAKEVADTLAKLRCCPEEEVKIREAVALLKSAADGVEPRRGNERS